MRNKTTNIFLGAALIAVGALLVVLLFQNVFSPAVQNEKFSAFLETQKDFSLFVPKSHTEVDGIHFEGGALETLLWGPKTYSVEPDGTVWIDDTAALRRIHVNADGVIIEAQVYKHGEEPKDTTAKQQTLSADLEEVKADLSNSPLHSGFTVSEVHYWGTSPEGYQYWQTTETRQDAGGVLRVRTFLRALNASGTALALAEVPVSSQYTNVFNEGVYVDAEHDSAFFMTTMSTGIRIQSIDWRKF